MAQTNRHLISRKTIYALIAILTLAVILLSAFTLFWHSGKPATENKAVDIKITGFYFTENWTTVGGLAYVAQFNMSVKNYGSTDVRGLILKVNMFDNGTDVGVGNYFFNDTNDDGMIVAPLKVGENKVYSGVLSGDITVVALPANTTIVRHYEVSVILNGSILDEKRISG